MRLSQRLPMTLWSDMRLGGEPVGRWGIALLAVTGIAGAILAAHGWAGRGAAATPALAGGPGKPSVASTPPASSPASGNPSPAGPHATASPSASSRPGAGPLLSSEPYARAAFLVWPGQPDAAARQALTGLTIKVRRQGTGLAVTAGVTGQPTGASHVYRNGARVYVVEASLGDDSGNSDYSLGDDGLVVTDRQGRIVQ